MKISDDFKSAKRLYSLSKCKEFKKFSFERVNTENEAYTRILTITSGGGLLPCLQML